MQKRPLITATLVLALIGAVSAQTTAPKKTTVTANASAAKPVVGNDLVSQAQLDLIVKERVAQGQADTPEFRAGLREELTNRALFVRAAKAKELDKDAAIKTQAQVAADSVLIRSYISDYLSTSPINDATLKQEYEKIKSGLGDKEYHARHILVETKEQAESLIKQLQSGSKFEDLAKANSKDPGSKENGGDLDWAVPSNYVKPFADAMIALEKGKYTATPVQSQFGFHIIKLDDTRAAKVPTLEEVKPQLTQRLQSQVIEKHLADLRSKAGVK